MQTNPYRLLILSVCFLLPLHNLAQTATETLAKADNLFASGNRTGAQTLYLRFAGDLTPAQQKSLATCYLTDSAATAATYKEGMRWLLQSANAGNIEAMNLAADIYGSGEFANVPQDKTKQVFWLQKSAGAGSKEAMVLLAKCYQVGWGIAANTALARQWYEAAWKKGDQAISLDLAKLEMSVGDTAKAYQILEAANRGQLYPQAAYLLAGMYEKGLGKTQPDPDAAFRWYYKIRRAKEHNDLKVYAQQKMDRIGRVEPPSDLQTVKPLLLKLAGQATKRYADILGGQVEPYNAQRFPGYEYKYYLTLLNPGFKNAYISKLTFEKRFADGVMRKVDRYGYAADIVHSMPHENAQQVYQRWAGIVKTIFSDWQKQPEINPLGTAASTLLTKTINGRTHSLKLELTMPGDGNRSRVKFELDVDGHE